MTWGLCNQICALCLHRDLFPVRETKWKKPTLTYKTENVRAAGGNLVQALVRSPGGLRASCDPASSPSSVLSPEPLSERGCPTLSPLPPPAPVWTCWIPFPPQSPLPLSRSPFPLLHVPFPPWGHENTKIPPQKNYQHQCDSAYF